MPQTARLSEKGRLLRPEQAGVGEGSSGSAKGVGVVKDGNRDDPRRARRPSFDAGGGPGRARRGRRRGLGRGEAEGGRRGATSEDRPLQDAGGEQNVAAAPQIAPSRGESEIPSNVRGSARCRARRPRSGRSGALQHADARPEPGNHHPDSRGDYRPSITSPLPPRPDLSTGLRRCEAEGRGDTSTCARGASARRAGLRAGASASSGGRTGRANI